MSENTTRETELNDYDPAEIEIELKAVMDGEIIRVEDIEDQVFLNKMIGDGYRIIPTGKKVYSLISGKIEKIASRKHAVYLSVEDQFKILII